jgi:hypothetical protein
MEDDMLHDDYPHAGQFSACPHDWDRTDPEKLHRRFHLQDGERTHAEGVEFGDGTVTLRWYSPAVTTGAYDSIEAVNSVHLTLEGPPLRISWID